MENAAIARVFSTVADLLEIQEANPFRVRAYRNAARTVETLTTPLEQMLAEGARLTELPGIGKEMASHIAELVESGELRLLGELAAAVPPSLLALMRLPGVGPKKARTLWEALAVTSVDELEAAARAGKVAQVKGFGETTQKKILEGIAVYRQQRSRVPLKEADRVATALREWLAAAPGLERLEVAGSFRRRRDTVADLDLVAVARDDTAVAAVMERLRAYPRVERVESAGETRSTAVLDFGMQVDLRVVPRKSFGAALVYFTGSKDHNIKLRRLGVAEGLRISEYGVFEVGKRAAAAEEEAGPRDPWAGKWIAGREEKDVYAAVGLPWIPPELREDRGEIEAAGRGGLPRLLETGDLRGDLQMHSTWSDGRDTLEAMLEGCAARGYQYFAITDHSPALAMVRGLTPQRLRQQWREIDRVEKRHPEIRVLRSMEVDILLDGRLDLADDLLARLDLVVASIHSHFDLPAAQQTERLLRALEHPAVDVLAHPTGRKIGRREPMRLDVEAVLRRCAERGVAVECNAQPDRLDLRDTHLLRARELGVKVVVSTDAHRVAELDFMRWGVEQARRAWLSKKDVLNTLPLPKFLAALEALRRRRRKV